MPKEKKLFDEDSEEEVNFITENEYAKKYDSWREKEEIHKLEQKYGSKALSSDASVSSDSEDDDEPPEVSEETETQFLKTLALLKTKDPRIYDPGYTFFENEEKEKEKQPKAKTLTFEDSDDDDDEENDGNIFKVEKKAEILNEKVPEASETESSSSKKTKKEGKLKDYLTGRVEHVDREVEQDLAPLKALWSDPKLNEGEAFLRDYILNQRYLEDGEGEPEKLRDDEDLEEDERRVEEQGKFERAYNFRFEEPDEEYLKRFPRTMNSIRPKDDRRSRKRAEVRTRKEEEKKRKMEEISRLKALKLKEIQEKIAKIKEVTGNQELAFKDDDLEGDFDPEQHDKRMQAIFDEQYYGEADGEKPVFPDLDEELEIENWENYEPEHDPDISNKLNDEPHCEDEDFNMDADYDPKQARISLLEQIQSTLTKKPRNRKKKSKLAELLTKEKPKYVPAAADKTYAQYMDEYYKLDCEDVIGGDLPTRFKYRDVVANDYGLTIEEILLADDKELTQWVPLKRIVRHRPADIEKSEVNTYAQRAADVRLKKKILPSLFKDLPEEPEIVVPVETSKKKKKKKKKNKEKEEVQINDNAELLNGDDIEHNLNEDSQVVDVNEDSTEVKSKKKKKKDKRIEDMIVEDVNTTVENNKESPETTIKQKKKKHKDTQIAQEINLSNTEVDVEKLEPKENNVELQNNTETTIPSQKKNNLLNSKVNVKELKRKENNVEVQKNIEATKQSKKKKKKQKIDGFTVETIQKAEPSQGSQINNFIGTKQNKKANLKRKLDTNNSQTPNKKKKTDFTNKKDKTKFKQKDKFKNKQGKDKTSDNPLSNLSDERLKAYGLNPKKYRSFLKYKKF